MLRPAGDEAWLAGHARAGDACLGEAAMSEPEAVVVPRELYYHEAAYVRGLEKLAQAVLLFHLGALGPPRTARCGWR